MNETRKDECRVPVVAEYRIQNGKPVMVSAQYADIPAPELLRFMLDRSGMQLQAARYERR